MAGLLSGAVLFGFASEVGAAVAPSPEFRTGWGTYLDIVGYALALGAAILALRLTRVASASLADADATPPPPGDWTAGS